MDTGLNREEQDALKEIVTIGAGNAATALSQMLKKKVTIEVPDIKLIPIRRAPDIFGGAETLITAVYLELLGDALGVILFCFHEDEGNKLTDILLGRPFSAASPMDEMALSALKETATILSGAYLNAIGRLLNMRLLVSSPGFSHDMAGAIVDNVLIEVSKEADIAIVMNTELTVVDVRIITYFFFIPDVASLGKILNGMGLGGAA